MPFNQWWFLLFQLQIEKWKIHVIQDRKIFNLPREIFFVKIEDKTKLKNGKNSEKKWKIGIELKIGTKLRIFYAIFDHFNFFANQSLLMCRKRREFLAESFSEVEKILKSALAEKPKAF